MAGGVESVTNNVSASTSSRVVSENPKALEYKDALAKLTNLRKVLRDIGLHCGSHLWSNHGQWQVDIAVDDSVDVNGFNDLKEQFPELKIVFKKPIKIEPDKNSRGPWYSRFLAAILRSKGSGLNV